MDDNKAKIEFIKALIKVQSTVLLAKKKSENPYFKSKYADLTEIWDIIRKPLLDNGFCITQQPGVVDGLQVLNTCLMHVGGYQVCGTYIINPAKNDPQGVGSAITYAKRYSLAAMIGVVSEGEDDDGEAATRGTKELETPKPAPKAAPVKLEPSKADKYLDDRPEKKKRNSPYWTSEFKGVEYIHVRVGDHYPVEWLQEQGFKEGKSSWHTHYDKDIIDKLELKAQEYEAAIAEMNATKEVPGAEELLGPKDKPKRTKSNKEKRLTQSELDALRQGFRNMKLNGDEVVQVLKPIIGTKPSEEWTVEDYKKISEFQGDNFPGRELPF